MNIKTLDAIKAHARQEYPRESCGLIVAIGKKESYVPCRNLSEHKEESFRMPAEDYSAAEDLGEVIAVVHSHPDDTAMASEGDKVAIELSGLPWHIIALNSTEFGDILTFNPCGYVPPLIGREFLHGVHDCYTIVQDFYERELGIKLMNFEREDDWWHKEQNLYLDNFQKAGFTELEKGETLQYGDVIIMQVRSPVPNHAGVFLGSGGLKEFPNLHPVPDAMLHHMYGRVSERAVYGGHWRECTRIIVRYRK